MKQQKTYDELLRVRAEHPVFNALSLLEIEEWSVGNFVTKPADRYLVHEAKPAKKFGMILEGAVRVHVRRDDEKEVLLKILKAPAIYGEIEVLTGHQNAASVSTLTPVRLFEVPSDIFGKTLCENAILCKYVAEDVARRLEVATTNEKALMFVDSTMRLARLLLDFCRVIPRSPDGHIWIDIEQKQIAKDLGLSRKAVIALFKSLRVDATIQRKGRSFYFDDFETMEMRAAGAPSLLHTMYTQVSPR